MLCYWRYNVLIMSWSKCVINGVNLSSVHLREVGVLSCNWYFWFSGTAGILMATSPKQRPQFSSTSDYDMCLTKILQLIVVSNVWSKSMVSWLDILMKRNGWCLHWGWTNDRHFAYILLTDNDIISLFIFHLRLFLCGRSKISQCWFGWRLSVI